VKYQPALPSGQLDSTRNGIGWIIPPPACAFVDTCSTLDSEEGFDKLLSDIVNSQVPGCATDLGELWRQCERQNGIGLVSHLWHVKECFTGICLLRFHVVEPSTCAMLINL
jgi:hypothetical protein